MDNLTAEERLMLLPQRLLASLDAAVPASSVFFRRSWVRSDWTVSGLGYVPEVDDIFL